MALRWLREAEGLEGKRVLLRIDANEPIKNGALADDFRLKKILPTIEFLRREGAKITLISHLETKSGPVSLAPVVDYLGRFFPVEFGDQNKGAEDHIHVLENLRLDPGEEANDPAFVHMLASYGDVYVNDAFAVSHRKHASIVGVPMKLPSYGGLLLESEVNNLSRAFDPEHPFIFIIGGVKFSTKVPLVKKILKTADKVFIYGALANSFFKERGYEVGNSVVEDATPDLKEISRSEKVVLPRDVVVARGAERLTILPGQVQPGDVISDAGPKAVLEIEESIRGAKLVLWNGPLGKYEEGYPEGTDALAKVVAGSGAFSIVGGGDTIASIESLNLMEKFGFVSTGGGAMLEFLADETLPGLEALKNSPF